MPTTSPADDIIEKRDTSMLAVSCLVIACVALIGAIAFQLMELGEYKRGGVDPKYAQHKTPAQKRADDAVKGFRDNVDAILTRTAEAAAAGDAGEGTTGGAGAADGAGADADAEPDAGATKDAGDEKPADADAGEAGDEKAGADEGKDEGAGDEAAPPADEEEK